MSIGMYRRLTRLVFVINLSWQETWREHKLWMSTFKKGRNFPVVNFSGNILL
jgi:hypothetical protein